MASRLQAPGFNVRDLVGALKAHRDVKLTASHAQASQRPVHDPPASSLNEMSSFEPVYG
jgi:hypothetical protein